MNRRSFLGAIAAAVAGAKLDPERALWVPGRKLISIPRRRIMIGDTITVKRPIRFARDAYAIVTPPLNLEEYLERVAAMQAEILAMQPRAPWIGAGPRSRDGVRVLG